MEIFSIACLTSCPCLIRFRLYQVTPVVDTIANPNTD